MIKGVNITLWKHPSHINRVNNNRSCILLSNPVCVSKLISKEQG